MSDERNQRMLTGAHVCTTLSGNIRGRARSATGTRLPNTPKPHLTARTAGSSATRPVDTALSATTRDRPCADSGTDAEPGELLELGAPPPAGRSCGSCTGSKGCSGAVGGQCQQPCRFQGKAMVLARAKTIRQYQSASPASCVGTSASCLHPPGPAAAAAPWPAAAPPGRQPPPRPTCSAATWQPEGTAEP